MKTALQPPLVRITLTQADLDRLDGSELPIWEVLGVLDVEIQRILGLDWRDIEIELCAEGGRALGHRVVEQALLNLGL